MPLRTIAILSPGDMGSAVGRALGENGYDIITCLQGRSERTRNLAKQANFRDVPTLEDMVQEADLILSIMVPAQAVDTSRRVADAIRATSSDTPYADCNAVSPQTTQLMETAINSAGGRFIDGGIIGGPPGRGAPPRFYVSGANSDVMNELDGKGITIKNIGGAVGRASGVKMCYAAMTKGTSTLQIALLTAAEALGLTDELLAEFQSSQPNALKQMENITRLPANAHRWIGEMEEISATFDAVGVTPDFHKGAAEIYRLLSQTPFADESPETVDRSRSFQETIKAVVNLLPNKVESGD